MAQEIDTTNSLREPAGAQLPIVSLAELDTDPHSVFRKYREMHSVVTLETGTYVVLRFSDIDRMSKDARLRAAEMATPMKLGLEHGTIFEMYKYGMANANGDVHRRRRAPFSKLFSARAVSEMRPHIRRTIEDVIDGLYDRGEMDLVDTFASPIPARVIADLFGLPREDIPYFARECYEVMQMLSFGLSSERIAEIGTAAERLRDYISGILDERRRRPGDDFLSAYLAAATEAGEMSPEEMLYQIFLLVTAGTDATRISIAIQTSLLLQHRRQWMDVCGDPALIPAAVAEALRFEPSSAGVRRIASENIEVSAMVIPAGEIIYLSTMSALRDERVYGQADLFDIHRTDSLRLHPVFGYGAHRCIGEALARVELEESLAAVTARFPQMQMDLPPAITGHSGVRRVSAMQVSWKP